MVGKEEKDFKKCTPGNGLITSYLQTSLMDPCCGFSRVSAGFSSYDGEFRLPLVCHSVDSSGLQRSCNEFVPEGLDAGKHIANFLGPAWPL